MYSGMWEKGKRKKIGMTECLIKQMEHISKVEREVMEQINISWRLNKKYKLLNKPKYPKKGDNWIKTYKTKNK